MSYLIGFSPKLLAKARFFLPAAPTAKAVGNSKNFHYTALVYWGSYILNTLSLDILAADEKFRVHRDSTRDDTQRTQEADSMCGYRYDLRSDDERQNHNEHAAESACSK